MQAYPTIPRSNDNKDAVILPGTLPLPYRRKRGMSADFVLILGDRPLGKQPGIRGLAAGGHPRRARGASVLSKHRAALLDRVHGARGQLNF